jgi:hypothetical protein
VHKIKLSALFLLLTSCLFNDPATAIAFCSSPMSQSAKPYVPIPSGEMPFGQSALSPAYLASQYPGKNGNFNAPSRRDFIRLATGLVFMVATGKLKGEEVRQSIVSAAEQLLKHLEIDGWLPDNDEWTAGERKDYVDTVSAFVSHPQLADSTDRPSFLWVDPTDQSRILFRPDAIAAINELDLEMVLAHVLLHQTPRHLQLKAEADHMFQMVAGRPIEEQAAVKHGVALLATAEREATLVELRIAEHQAYLAKETVDANLNRRAGEAKDDTIQKLFEDLAKIHKTDPPIEQGWTRAGLIRDMDVKLSQNFEKYLEAIYNALPAHGPPGGDAMNAWVTLWITSRQYAELRINNAPSTTKPHRSVVKPASRRLHQSA